ncbi:bifunctional DNA-binding transcriptional regulator/O6-methylguanine-DNA methyltransferase Ada [Woodsholea maritima]|uniref:bifunctional DNA-binding transcriptional regulator/O6-methylguanine-DNA methyltransferase Ada n=1 Tax=Woodsholea maritima TaxID=240237 RepID=UPI000361E9E5|nr:bifunctional DNA-binding transcriptional regulator/O6-methylguanine-DNA methyltransferase Ada [Woodsholea maritima]
MRVPVMTQPANDQDAWPDDEARWAAVRARDANADEVFWYGVMTTGVYCRPSCASRGAKRQNVQFFDSREAARAAGLRACKRCKPDGASLKDIHRAKIIEACRLIETAEEEPSLDDLARHVGISAYHFHRLFKAHMGMTAKAYAKANRAQRVRARLAKARSVTEAIYDAGYNSASRFYVDAARDLSVAPARLNKKAKGEVIRFGLGPCSLGHILVAASARGVCSILLGDSPERLIEDFQADFADAELVGGDEEFEAWMAAIIGHVEDPHQGLDLPLDIRGTVFQQQVWQALRTIPPGETVSYSQLAQKLGQPKASRAVAKACATNRIAVAIPCHRVVRQDGSLSGYRWGVERKEALLAREALAS